MKGLPRKISCSAIDPNYGSSFFSLSEESNWYDAAKLCKKSGAHLSTILSEEQTERILYSVQPARHLWIGASNTNSDAKDEYKWIIDNSRVRYQNWENPNGQGNTMQCVEIEVGWYPNPGSGKWVGNDCSTLHFPLCELNHDYIDYNNTPCPDCFHGRGAYYNGHVSTTATNKTCATWSKVASVKADEITTELENPANYCRNMRNADGNKKQTMPWCYTIPDSLATELPSQRYNWDRSNLNSKERKMASLIKKREPCLIPKCEGFSEDDVITSSGIKCDFNSKDPLFSSYRYPIFTHTCIDPKHKHRVEWELNWDTHDRYAKGCHVTYTRTGEPMIGGTIAGKAGGNCNYLCPKSQKYCSGGALYPTCTTEEMVALEKGLTTIKAEKTGSMCIGKKILQNGRECKTSVGTGECHRSMKGTWSDWKQTGLCSRNCGDGYLVEYRYCIFPPCVGSSFKQEISCKEADCDEQYVKSNCYDNNGIEYTGNVDQPISKTIQCITWKSTSHPYFKVEHYHTLEGRRCRNPGGFRNAPWCFIDKSVRGKSQAVPWAYCNISPCQQDGSHLIALKVQVMADTAFRKKNKITKLNKRYPIGCQFPFLYRGIWHQKCTLLHSDDYDSFELDLGDFGLKTRDIRVCSIASVLVKESLLICADSLIFWSNWLRPSNNTCYPLFGPDRQVVQRQRFCRSGRCEGEDVQLTGEKCNDTSSIINEWGAWSYYEGNSGCTKTCGGGRWRISRTCTASKTCKNGKKEEITEYQCNTQPCYEDKLILCTKECGGGKRKIISRCKRKSKDCKDMEEITNEDCNTHMCIACYDKSPVEDVVAYPKQYKLFEGATCSVKSSSRDCIVKQSVGTDQSHPSHPMHNDQVCPVCTKTIKFGLRQAVCCPMPECAVFNVWKMNPDKELNLLAARLTDRKDNSFYNTRFNGLCSFPVSVYGYDMDEKVILDYNYCTAIKNIETKQIARIGFDEFPMYFCRSGFDYDDQFYDNGNLKTISTSRTYNFYGQCLHQLRGSWSSWETGTSSCSVSCGGGLIYEYRICRYPPCVGKSFQLSDISCNKQPCHDNTRDGLVPDINKGNTAQLTQQTAGLLILFLGCDNHFISSTGASCEYYHSEKFCTLEGQYGTGWKSHFGTFADYKNPITGHDALSCRLCGCHDNTPDCFYGNGFMYRGSSEEPVGNVRKVVKSKFEKWRALQTTDYVVTTSNNGRTQKECWKVCRDEYKQLTECEFCNEDGKQGYCCSLDPNIGFDQHCKKLSFFKKLKEAMDQYRIFSGYGNRMSVCVVKRENDMSVDVVQETCLPWSSIANYSVDAYVDYGLEYNFCRNPDNRAAPYCYTKYDKDEIRWEYCNIQRCEVGTSSITALPSSNLQYSKLSRVTTETNPIEFNPKTFGWKADQKKSRVTTKLPFDWPWKYLSNKQDYYHTKCQFPFYLDKTFGKFHGWHDQCVTMFFTTQRDLPLEDVEQFMNSYYVCRIDTMVYLDDHPVLGICYSPGMEVGKGIWSSWGAPECPSCGGEATAISRRYCRIGDCNGDNTRPDGDCNTQVPCTDTCLNTAVNGTNYIGKIAVDYKSRPCLRWEDTLIGRKHIQNYAGSENFCRNRHLNAPKLFCVIEKFFGNYEISQCNIPLCKPSDGVVLTEHNNYCQFPFKDTLGVTRERCIKDQEGDMKCYGGTKKRGIRQMEECIHSFIGTWSNWIEVECNKPCGGGEMIRKRICRFSPCIDSIGKEAIEETVVNGDVVCNTISCDKTRQDNTSSITVAAKGGRSPLFDRQCRFPFVYNNVKYMKCLTIEPPTNRGLERYQGAGSWCGLVPDINKGNNTQLTEQTAGL